MSQFDKIYDRSTGESYKWRGALVSHPDLIGMSVADMDFPLAQPIQKGLTDYITHDGIFGYDRVSDDYYNSVISWMERRHHWSISKDAIVLTAGVVMSINVAVQSLTEVDDAIMIMTPVYYPFRNAIENNHRHLVTTSLTIVDNRYELDFTAFEKAIAEHNVKMLIFCHPHNPVGKVWSRDELQHIGEICEKYHVIVISDEIHMDFVYEPRHHIPFVCVDERFKDFTITCTAASKSFNLAGFYNSNIIIDNRELRQQFIKGLSRNGISSSNNLGMLATQLAYSDGEEWFNEVKAYIKGNIDFMDDYLKTRLPMLKMMRTEGLYLTWVDCRALGLDAKALDHFMLEQAHLYLDDGALFGKEGEGFQRFNMACSRKMLKRALQQLESAILSL